MASTINGTSTGNGGLVTTGDDSGILQLQTNETTAVTIDASQNVGIGTSSPASPLDLKGKQLYRSGSDARTASIYNNGDGTFRLGSEGANGITEILFNKYGGTEAMRIDSSGNLLVGTTSTGTTTGDGVKIFAPNTEHGVTIVTSRSDNNSVSYSLYSRGASAYRFYVGNGGTIYATSTTIQSTSDIRLKENIRELDDGLEKVMALQPRKFDWKEGKGADIKNARGFIAQEFEQVFPDLVGDWLDPAPEGEEPYKSVRADLIPTLVKAIQEQQAMIASQSEQISSQAAVITTLTERITALEGATQ